MRCINSKTYSIIIAIIHVDFINTILQYEIKFGNVCRKTGFIEAPWNSHQHAIRYRCFCLCFWMQINSGQRNQWVLIRYHCSNIFAAKVLVIFYSIISFCKMMKTPCLSTVVLFAIVINQYLPQVCTFSIQQWISR